MSIDAIAVLPSMTRPPPSEPAEGEWRSGEGPSGGGLKAWLALADCTLLALGLPYESPDAQLYGAANRWMGKVPARLWIFPDTAVPGGRTAREVRTATRDAGRWVRRGVREPSGLEKLGFTGEQADAWQGEINSGDPARVKAAFALLERHLEGKDPAEVEAIVQESMKRR